MIISSTPKPTFNEFKSLMKKTDIILNSDALLRPEYYVSRNGQLLEQDVSRALVESAKGTPFEGTIELVSGQKFPDIVAAKLYGIEVKSTKDDHWTSTGSSILESTRVHEVNRIFLTFGKLGGSPIEFISKPYEECLHGIAVTHMPRYLINMQLPSGETIFEKMGIPYDELRKMDNPIAPVAKYYRSQLKEGESLWWTGDSVDETVSPTIKLWKNLSVEEKRFHTIYGCVNFPEIFGGNYDRYALWLTSQGIVDPHIRDQFSAGGKEEMLLSSGLKVKVPGVYRRIKNNYDLFIQRMRQDNPALLIDNEVLDDSSLRLRILKWIEEVSQHSGNYGISVDALQVFLLEKPIIQKSKLSTNERIVLCKQCGRFYIQSVTKQIEGLRFREDDYCPYCSKSNGSSLEWDFHNRKC